MKLNTMQSLAFSSSFLAMSIGAGSALADVPNVAVDIAPVHGLVSMVMGDLGQPNLILPQNASPHGFAMRPADARALHSADLVFWTSPELTPWLVRALESRPSEGVLPPLMENPDIVTFTFRDNPLFEHDDHGHEEHAEAGHDDHGHEEHAEAAHDDHGHEEHADAGHDDHDHEEHAEAGHDDHDHEEHAEAGHDDHDHEEHTEAGHDDQDHEEHADAGHDDHDHEEHAEAGHDDHDHEEHAEAGHDDHGHEEHAEAGHDDHGHHDHHHAEGAIDPHGWLDPENAKVWLGVIAADLAAADPENAETYQSNAAQAQAQIDATSHDLEHTLEGLTNTRYAVFHDAYQYFENRYGLTPIGAISLGDASGPGPAHLSALRAELAEQNAVCIFAEPQFNPSTVNSIADGTDLRVAVMDPLGFSIPLGQTFYPTLIEAMGASIVECAGQAG